MHVNRTNEAILKYIVESKLMSLPTANDTMFEIEAKVPAMLIPTTAPWIYRPPAAPAIPNMVPWKMPEQKLMIATLTSVMAKNLVVHDTVSVSYTHLTLPTIYSV